MAFNRITDPFNGQVTNTDLDLSMNPNPATGDLRVKTNLDSIIQSMKTLLFTNYGERPFRPSLSCNMQKLLFNQIDRVSILQLQTEISQTLTAFEPRVNIVNVQVAQGNDPHEVVIIVQFTLVNSPTIISISVFLGRKR